jgi:chemotaxis receptor (MCP) glutamine deamidase CheD
MERRELSSLDWNIHQLVVVVLGSSVLLILIWMLHLLGGLHHLYIPPSVKIEITIA